MKAKLFKLLAVSPIEAYEDYSQEKLSKDTFLFITSIVLATGAFVHGYLLSQLQLDSTSSSAAGHDLVSVLYVSEAVGALASFAFMDELGRRTALLGASVLCMAGLLLLANISSGVLLALPVTGIALGAAANASAVYLAEVAPAAQRGACLGMLIVLSRLGAACQLVTSSVVLPVAALCAQSLLLLRLPESPRWLLAKRSPTDCSLALRQWRRSADTAREFSDLYRALSTEARLSDTLYDLCLLPSVRMRTALMLVLVSMHVPGSGTEVIISSRAILTQCADPAQQQSLVVSAAHAQLLVLLIAIAGCAGSYAASACVDYCYCGRRGVLLLGSLAVAATSSLTTSLAAEPCTPWVVMEVLALISYAVALGASSVVLAVYAAELFPSRARAKLYALLVCWHCLGGALLRQPHPSLPPPLTLRLLASLATAVFAFIALPETRALCLEEMEDLFALPAHPNNSSCWNPSYLCCCVPRIWPPLGFRGAVPRNRNTPTHGLNPSDGLVTPRKHHSGSAPYTPVPGGTSSAAEQAVGEGVGEEVDQEEEAVVFEPSRLHKYSNEMGESKFNYYYQHHPHPHHLLQSPACEDTSEGVQFLDAERYGGFLDSIIGSSSSQQQLKGGGGGGGGARSYAYS